MDQYLRYNIGISLRLDEPGSHRYLKTSEASTSDNFRDIVFQLIHYLFIIDCHSYSLIHCYSPITDC